MDYNFEIWSNEVAANLYGDTKWYTVLQNWSRYANGETVHLPQSPVVGSARALDGSTVFPVATVDKTFLKKTFDMNIVGADPRKVKITQDAFNNIDTRTELMADMVGELETGVSNSIINALKVTGSRLIRTSGASTYTNFYGKASVKAMVEADILAARGLLGKDKADMGKLVMFVDSITYTNAILKMAGFNRDTVLSDKVLTEGYVGSIYGIKVYEVSGLGIAYTAAGAVPTLELDGSYDNTHFSGALIVDTSKAGYAVGETKVKVDEYATGYYGDVMQGHTTVGAASKYADNKGVVAIIETV